MLTLKDYAARTKINDAFYADMAEMLSQPNPLLEGYGLEPFTYRDRVNNLWDRVKDSVAVLLGKKVAVTDEYYD